MAIPHNILIVGGGVFGLSTALSLSTRHPTTKITLLESSSTIPNPHGSSVDASRIVRADYSSPVYTNLAAAAIQRWRNTDWGREGRYTQNGLLLVYPPGNTGGKEYAQKSYENVRSLVKGGDDNNNNNNKDMVEYLHTKDEVLRVVPEYGKELNVDGGYVNWGSGWSNAEESVRYAKKRLDQEGKVVFKTGEVERILFDDNKTNKAKTKNKSTATGVLLTNGTTISADLTILATGAWTPKLVDLRSKAISTGQVIAFLQISDEEQARLADMPTILNFATGIFVIPPRNNLLKIARHSYGYHNPKTVPVPIPDRRQQQGETMEISLPEPGVPIPQEGEDAIRSALKALLPSFADRPFTETRVCWYTDTPKGDFLITYHPSHNNLFLATGGSGHAYKFFPVIGDKVVDALEGNLESELKHMWTWSPTDDDNQSVTGVSPSFGSTIVTEDGSRSGAKGLKLMEELAKGKKERRGGSAL